MISHVSVSDNNYEDVEVHPPENEHEIEVDVGTTENRTDKRTDNQTENRTDDQTENRTNNTGDDTTKEATKSEATVTFDRNTPSRVNKSQLLN